MRIKIDIEKYVILLLVFILLPGIHSYGENAPANTNARTYDAVSILNAFSKAIGHDSGSPEANAAYVKMISAEAKTAGSILDDQAIYRIGNQLKSAPGDMIAAEGHKKVFEGSFGAGLTDAQTTEQAASFIEQNMNFGSVPQISDNSAVITPPDMNKIIAEQNRPSVEAANELDQMDPLELGREKDAMERSALDNVAAAAQSAATAAIEAAEAEKKGDGTADEKKKEADQKKDEADKAVKKAAEVLPDKTDKIQEAAKKGTDVAVKEAQDKGVSVDVTVIATQVTESLNKVSETAKQEVVNTELAKQDSSPANDDAKTAPQPAEVEPAPATTPEPSDTGDKKDIMDDVTVNPDDSTPVVDTPQEVSTSH